MKDVASLALGGSNTATGAVAATMNFGVPDGRKAGYTGNFRSAGVFCAATGVVPECPGGIAGSAGRSLQPVSTDATAAATAMAENTENRAAPPPEFDDVIVSAASPRPADALFA
jgi:hypothetical protein